MTGRYRRAAVAVVVAAVVVTGCRSPLQPAVLGGGGNNPAPAGPVVNTAPAAAVTGAGQFVLIQEPAAGYDSILAGITTARRTVEMTIYELADPAAQADLIAAHRRGVAVRVILDRAFHGQQVNHDAYTQLAAAGVAVRWAPAGQIFHQKTITIDGTRSLIGTGNLTARYYPDTRDAFIDDRNPAQVRAIAATFDADWNSPQNSGPQAGAAGLVWSPGAGQQIAAYLGSARRSVQLTSEELSDPRIVAALTAAARRGVSCRIVMTASKDWTPAFTTVTKAGCTVHTYPDTTAALYIHEKLILIDGVSMLIGSQNATATSLNKNRELSVIVTTPQLVQSAAATFAADYRTAPPWTNQQG